MSLHGFLNLLNAVSILLVAILFNGLFRWRRYPAHMHARQKTVQSEVPGYAPIKHEDFVYALSQIDTFVDITEEDLLAIY
jgi:CBS-domain-containing membrane protein